ncbi:MAG TPA: rod shape-determining protein MreD [Chitinivibrionales bacterium]
MSYLKWPLLFIGCFLLQTSFVPAIAVFGIKPDLLMIILFFFSIRYGIMPGLLMGFFIGLTQDLYTPAILGQNALTKTIVGACIGLFNEKVMRTDPFVKSIILFVMFLVNDALFTLVLVVKNNTHISGLLLDLAMKTIPRALYSVVLAALFYAWEFFPKSSGRKF